MSNKKIHALLTFCIAVIWIVNGLFCKVLHLVPRHQQIVARILGEAHSGAYTVLIGISEIGMAVWTLSRISVRLNVLTQIIIIAFMNTLEFVLAPDLLLWGKMNSVFALLFIIVIYLNEFYLHKK